MTRTLLTGALACCLLNTAAATPITIVGKAARLSVPIGGLPEITTGVDIRVDLDIPDAQGKSAYSTWRSWDVVAGTSGFVSNDTGKVIARDGSQLGGWVRIHDDEARDATHYDSLEISLSSLDIDITDLAGKPLGSTYGDVSLRITENRDWMDGLRLADLPVNPSITGDDDSFRVGGIKCKPFSLITYRPGDANTDGAVNQLDLIAVLQGGKYLSQEPATWTEGDWNSDGAFDQLDIVAALPHYGTSSMVALAAVPEPRTLFLAFSGFMLLTFLTFRRANGR